MLAKIKDPTILKIKSDLEDELGIKRLPIYATDRINQRACIMGFWFFSIIYLHVGLIRRENNAEIEQCILHELLHYKYHHVFKAFLYSIFLPCMAKKKVKQYEEQVRRILWNYQNRQN